MNAAAKLAIVPDDAAALLDLLAPGEPVTFQTFDDDKDRKSGALVRVLHGTLAQHRHTLTSLNARGAGVYWMPNRGDLKGRKATNVRSVRALFVDLDGASLEPVKAAPLEPHCIVASSPGRWHAYWRVADCPLDQYAPMQKGLAARFAADPSVCDLPRVLRLPGFDHRKGKPYRSRILELHDVAPYTLAALQDAFAIFHRCPTQETQETQETQVRGEWATGESAKARIAVERFIPATVGQRNRCLFALARYIKARTPDATRAELRDCVKQWHARAWPVIGTTDFAESWGDFMRGWEKVRFVEGALMTKLLEKVDADPLPDGLPDDYAPRTLRLVRICGRLQRYAGNDPFYLSARTAGDLLGVHFTSAASMLYALVADHVLDGVSCGTLTDRRASEYRMPRRGDER